MGLLDWLTDGLGDLGGSAGPGMGGPMDSWPGPGAGAAPAASAPPMTTGAGNPTADLSTFDIGAGMTPGEMPTPAPDLSTSDLGGGMTTGRMPPPAIPPAAAPTSGTGSPQSLAPPAPLTPAPAPAVSPDLSGNAGVIGRALGLSAGGERKMMSSLASGLKSVGDNWNKPGLAAFSGSAGSALEGGNKADQQEYDNKIKALTQAVAYQKAGDDANYKKAYVQYLGASLKDKTDKAASKSAAWNKPDSQKFIDAQNALARDPDIRASEKILEGAIKSGDPDQVAKAQAAHTALVAQKRQGFLQAMNLSPQTYAAMSGHPPGGAENPHTFSGEPDAIQKQFDTYVKPGDYYVNPRDGKVYVRKPAGSSGSDSAAAASSATPKIPTAPSDPMRPNNPPKPADDSDDDED